LLLLKGNKVRYRIDTNSGYISFDESQYKEACEFYEDPNNNAIRLLECKDIFDEGVVLRGNPVISDLTIKYGLN